MQFLIQGCFFQNGQQIELAALNGDGDIAMVPEDLCQNLFGGVIWHDPTDRVNPWRGRMLDTNGASSLTDIRLSEFRLSFVKLYDDREGVATFAFERKDGDTYIGGFSVKGGSTPGGGLCRCVLVHAEPNFFDAKDMAKKLQPTISERPEQRRMGRVHAS